MDLVGRVKGILLSPHAEWPVIEREPGDATSLFTQYVAPLALIPAVSGFIAGAFIGYTMPNGTTLTLPFFTSLFSAIFGYVLTFVVVYVVAWIIDQFAPTFGGRRDFPNALKLAVYSYTPSWLAGIFLLVPGLRFLAVLGLYGLYLLWSGLPPLMKAPREKAFLYAAAVVVSALVLALVLGLIQSAFFTLPTIA